MATWMSFVDSPGMLQFTLSPDKTPVWRTWVRISQTAGRRRPREPHRERLAVQSLGNRFPEGRRTRQQTSKGAKQEQVMTQAPYSGAARGGAVEMPVRPTSVAIKATSSVGSAGLAT